MRDATLYDTEMLLCDIEIALEAHPPWYMDKGPATAPHRMLAQSADIIRRLLDEIENLKRENSSLRAEIDDMGDELYRLEG